MKRYYLFAFYFFCLCGVFSLCGKSSDLLFAENFPDKVKSPIKETIRIRQETQRSEDDWSLEREKLTVQYEALLKKQAHLASVRDRLNKEITFYTTGIESLKQKIEDVSRISEEISPYLDTVYDRLKELVDNGVPFLVQERQNRIHSLRRILDDSQVEVSEKFRKVMEAVFVEAEYGNTIEVYQQRIAVNGKEIRADIFRLGRVSLFFQSLDQTITGCFDIAAGGWKILPKTFNRDINTAIEIGSKRRPVELVNLPLGRISIQ